MGISDCLTNRNDICEGDYVSEGLSVVMPDACFPNMVIGDKANHPWPYLRREIEHNWYCDRRAPTVGFLNRDEAILLYNLALQFRGKPALEVGSWMGWSTCHLALAGLALDVVDPVLADPEHSASIRSSLAAADVLGNVRLYSSASPDGIRDLARLTGIKWNLFFIDGSHEAPAPVRDVRECLEHAAPDAMMVLHDLVVPDVEEALQVLWREGWQVLLYQTMQVVGVAWRGQVRPVAHDPDPSIIWSLPQHLSKYPVSGSSPGEEARRLFSEIARSDAEITRLQQELTAAGAQLDSLRSEMAGRDAEAAAQQLELSRLRDQSGIYENELNRLKDQSQVSESELGCLKDQSQVYQSELSRLKDQTQIYESELGRLRDQSQTYESELGRLKDQSQTYESELTQLRAEAVEMTNLRGLLVLHENQAAAHEEKLALIADKAQKQENELASLRAAAAVRQSQLTAREEELVRLGERARAQENELNRLQTQAAELATLRGVLITRDQELAALRERAGIQGAKLAELQALSASREQERESIRFEVNTRRGETQRLALDVLGSSREVDRLSSEVSRLQQSLVAVGTSASWKLTRPLRAIKDAGRFVKRIPRRFKSAVAVEAAALPANMPARTRFVTITSTIARRVSQRRTNGAAELSIVGRSFDAESYSQDPNGRYDGLDPVEHYMLGSVSNGMYPHPLFDAVFYCEANPDVVASGIDPLLHYALHGAAEGRDPHPLFDTSFYIETNLDVAASGINPLLHYALHGAAEGRDPHPLFDTSFYIETNPDVAASGINPLLHYVLLGAGEGRSPHPLFDASFYISRNPDVAESGMSPLLHYVLKGAGEGRNPHPLFDASFYSNGNPDVAESGMSALLHYVLKGAGEGRNPHPLFDASFYINANPGVADSGLTALIYYVLHGAAEGHDPHPLFDTSFYCETNPDVVESGMNPLVHYVLHGAEEGRDPHPLLAASFYNSANPDVAKSGMSPLLHYVLHGAGEGRDPHPLFNTSFYNSVNPDVAKSGMSPLTHYLLHGAGEGRDPHPLFSTSFYSSAYPDVAASGMNPLLHYVLYGTLEDRDPHPQFDASFYFDQNPHLRGLGINPLVHFLNQGPTEDFDPFSAAPPLPESDICIVTPDIVGPVKNGGIGTACYHFARVLAEAGHKVSIFFTGDVTVCQKAHWRNVYAKKRIRFIALSDAPPVTRPVYGSSWFLERSWRVFQYLREARFSIIHFQDWQGNGFWSIKAKQVGIAFDHTTLTVMTHSCTKWINEGMQQFSATPFETAKQVWVESYCIERCDILLSPSRYMFQWIRESQIGTPKRMLLTPYPWTDAPAAPLPPQPLDNEHLIFFGRLETRKGLHIFAEALRRLKREGGAALPREISFTGKHASVLGQPSRDYLADLQRDLPTVKIHVIDHFNHTEAMDYIRDVRGLVVLPSIVDNYPMTVIESVKSGVPFIAATTGGIPEMIDRRVSFEPTPAALAEILKVRYAIDHAGLKHEYASSAAAVIWCDLHADIRATAAALQTVKQNGAVKVSVCIPFFNHEQYLQTLVTAFERQGYPAFEVVMVNDGSSPEASLEFNKVATRNRDRRFRFLTTENQGPGFARNLAAAEATGDLLLFFDADNLPKGPDFIGTLVRALQRCNADCVTCPYDIVNTDRILVTESDVVATYRPVGGCVEAGFFENTLGDATMIISRQAFDKLAGFSTRRATWEDHEFLLNLCFQGLRLETLPEATFYYRQSPAGRNQTANEFKNYQSLFEQLQSAPPQDLARIIAEVAGPMLIGRPGSPSAKLVAQ